MPIHPLSSEQLYRRSELNELDATCTSTKHLLPLDEIVGQARAQHAVEFALSMKEKGYNIYALGRNGLGKRTMILRHLNKQSTSDKSQSFDPLYDWCYVVNFDDARQPRVLKLPAEMGPKLKKDIETLMQKLSKALPLAFDNEMYYARADKLKNQLASKQEQAIITLTNDAQKLGVSLSISTKGNYELIALNGEEAHTEESYSQLSYAQQTKLQTAISKLEAKLRGLIRQITVWEEEYTDKQQKHDEQVAEDVLSHSLHKLKEKYKALPQIKQYLKAMRKDILDNLDIFLEENEEQIALAYAALSKKMPRRYQVNVLVSQAKKSPPIIIEDSPNYHTLFGYVENATYKGTVITDFSLIRAGSLHKANGGVLMIDAVKVLEHPHVWDGLKRALRSKKLSLSSLEREVTLSGAISLDPEAIPLNIKIILFGDHHTYKLLQRFDPEFCELFKVTADFEDKMPRTHQSERHYAQFISSIVHSNKMLHCDRAAIARIIEFSSRQVDCQDQLSLHSVDVANLLREANYCARSAKATLIRASHIEQALRNKELRICRAKDEFMQSFVNGTTLLQTQGKTIGQVNALSVMSTSDYLFGAPSRITATTSFGEGKVFDIERKVELSGSIHSKGVMILSAFLASILGKTDKIPLSTHLTFEQSYGGVDGDSATMAELCTILSSIADLPLRQDIAITGSMNQFGESQPIGGVNEKIEGFFDVCQIKGYTQTQGVIIPRSNIHNLMLRKDIITAVKKGQFHIWAIDHVDQAIELLMGTAIGKHNPQGHYPETSVLGLAHAKLAALRAQSPHSPQS
ncbi:Lon protease family protein [Shewanella surugensis]|uniref:endopeptidase La n=1 Tax=Shewanella surugensis TaxID=212020 RepID=A0ABT0L8E4_9GAMM|nr:ATP-binding protein [Shewanella surugensis]MCL1123765.1 AAA family ATPase [Shewanella surugensis]